MTDDGVRRRRRDDADKDEGGPSKRRRREEKAAGKEERRRLREDRQRRKGSSARDSMGSESTDEDGAGVGGRRQRDGDAFVWKKKNDLLKKKGVRVTPADEKRRMREMLEELERAKQRRAERDAERAEWEQEQAKLARDREQESNADWHRQEASFHGSQHFLRQAIRLRENRPTLSDSLARNVRLDLLDVLPDPRSPADYLDGQGALEREALEQLAEGIDLELEYIPDFPVEGDTAIFNRAARLEWWTSLETCLADMLTSANSGSGESARLSGVHAAVQEQLSNMLKGKNMDTLRKMESEISQRIEGGGVVDDDGFGEVDFWTAALARIRCLLARSRLLELTDVFAEERKRMIEAQPKDDTAVRAAPGGLGEGTDSAGGGDDDQMVRSEAAKGMQQDEEAFTDEVVVAGDDQPRRPYVPGYLWNDKYRPRKPRYYNRVHTGYDWTKYNRTHYDHDNPPPKTVQGYKFNIFYPDLIDRSTTPSFRITKTDNPEVSIITFKSGPPYEDLAFKIVNRPWEHSHRRGYRCSFDRGILHLWFNFQRYRYRR